MKFQGTYWPWLLVLAVLVVSGAWSQDDPRFDNTFGLRPPSGSGPIPGGHVISVVTTPDGFDNFDLGVDFAEPHASTNPRNPLQYFTAWNVNATRYTANGHDWTMQVPNFGASMQGDPITAYDSLGNLYYENMYGTTGIVGCRVIRSTDNGVTWTAGVNAISGVDKNWIACDQTMGPYANYVYTVMTASSGGNFARSTDQGVTWTTTFSPTTQSLPGMMVAVGPNVLGGNNISGGCVYVVTNSGSSFASTYTFYRSTNGGLTFSLMSAQNFANYVGTNVNGRNSVQNMRTRPYPFIASDNSFGSFRGRLYLVYASNNPSGNGNKPDLYCRYSTDHGATWSAPVTINDDPGSTNNHNWFPSIWCDKSTGRLYVKWYDSRNSPASDSTDVYASYSDNGGVTWAANQRLTNAKFKVDCPTCGGGGTPRYQGDYDAIMSNAHGAMAVWTDFRNGNFGSYTSYFPDFAMLVSPANAVMYTTDSSDVRAKVPAVKLYSQSVKFTAAVSPPGNFSFSFPESDLLTSFPDSLIVRVKTTNATPGNYTITIVGVGPNGTPVHRRTMTMTVQTPPATLTLGQPNGGESWSIGSSQTITWSSANLSGNVKIELSTNGGSTFPTVLFASTANDNSENWTVSGPATSTARIRISSVTQPSVADISNGNFAILQSSITVTAANGGEEWEIGTPQNITWTSSGVSGTVNVELSRNGGSSYETLFAGTANDGTESWVVTGASTLNALIRVTSVSTPAVTDVSNSQFMIRPAFVFLQKMHVQDAGGDAEHSSDSLDFGTAPGASTGIDALFGEYELPPLPPSGVFDVRWKLTGTQGMRRDIRDTLGGTHVQEIYIGLLQPGEAGYPFVLRWNSAPLPAGTFIIRDQFGGSVFLVNMKQQDSVVISDMEVTQFHIVYDAGNIVSSNAQNGWNIVSLPVTVADRQKSVVFPTSTSSAFAYTSTGYVNRDTLDYGLGYWLKFPSAQTLSVSGTAIATDSIDVVAGWNIIGSISSPVSTGSIVQIPGGIVVSPYFSYGVSGYGSATTIDPMKGYWVKASQNGKLVLQGSTSVASKPKNVYKR